MAAGRTPGDTLRNYQACSDTIRISETFNVPLAALVQAVRQNRIHEMVARLNKLGVPLKADAVFAPKPTCVVPKLKGRSLTAAKQAIRRAHCGIGRIRRAASHTVEKNHVISQKPKPNSRLKQGAKITLLVSKGHS